MLYLEAHPPRPEATGDCTASYAPLQIPSAHHSTLGRCHICGSMVVTSTIGELIEAATDDRDRAKRSLERAERVLDLLARASLRAVR